jgi:hypothetical protein
MSESEPEPTTPTTDNWTKIKAALAERITRRWNALARLSSDTLDADSIETRLEAVGEDAGALLALFDELERRVDRAFASQSRRTAHADRRGPDPVEFKSK